MSSPAVVRPDAALREPAVEPDISARPRQLATAAISGVSSAFAQTITQAETWDRVFAEHYGHDERVRQVWHNCGVERRHHVPDPVADADLATWGTERRMRRFQEAALELSATAARGALADAQLETAEVDSLTIVSTTGYGMPGVDLNLARELGLGAHTQRLHVGHMGCSGGISGLLAAADAAAARGQRGLLVCVELASLHIQPATLNFEEVIAHALFSDAASAVAIVPDGAGLQLIDAVSTTDSDGHEMVRLDVTELGFRVGISPQIPLVLQRHVADTVTGLLERNGLTIGEVDGWAVHPGGPAILDVVAEQLDLPDTALSASREVLRDHGHCSSATAFIVLEEVRRRNRLQRDDVVVLMAFGPGLTLNAALLRQL